VEQIGLPIGLADAIFQESPFVTLEKLSVLGYFDELGNIGKFVCIIDDYLQAREQREIARYVQRKRRELTNHLNKEKRRQRPLASDTSKNLLNIERRSRAAIDAYIKQYKKNDDKTIIWTHVHHPGMGLSAARYKYWLALYSRVVFVKLIVANSHILSENVIEKCERFVDRQLPLLKYIDDLSDSLGRPADDSDIDPFLFISNYSSLGNSYYPDDEYLIERTKRYERGKDSPRMMIVDTLGYEILSIEEQAEIVRTRVISEDDALISWLVDGTISVSDHTRPFAFDDTSNDYRWKEPWIRCKRFISAEDILSHTLWAGMLVILYQLDMIRHRDIEQKYRDAAYTWQMSFIDLIDICERAGRYDDVFMMSSDKNTGMSVLEFYYPWDERVFMAGDLPHLGQTLSIIPLYGESLFPSFDIGILFNKSLSFACVGRGLTECTRDAITHSTSTWKIVSRIIWCMLAGMYPGDKCRLRGNMALEVKRICASRDMLTSRLSIDENESCRIIFTAFRSYMAYYGSLNQIYSASAARYIDWYHMVVDTRQMSEIIRSSNMRADDAFAEALSRLKRYNKNSDTLVYRSRAECLSDNLFNTLSRALDKEMYRECEYLRYDAVLFAELIDLVKSGVDISNRNSDLIYRTDVQFDFSSIDYTDRDGLLYLLEYALEMTLARLPSYMDSISDEVKVDILNLMLRMPQECRFEISGLTKLCEKKYGGLSIHGPIAIRSLVKLYFKCAPPKDLNIQLASFTLYDIEVMTWYLHCARLFDRIHLIPLDAESQRKIELAMKTSRLHLYPGVQDLRDRDFNVYYTICCEKVRTETGSSFGHDKVKYDIRTHSVICKKKKRLGKYDIRSLAPTSDIAEIVSRARCRKTRFLHIPCDKQPVLMINIRGFQLQVGTRRGTKRRFQHCPECACFHIVKMAGFTGDGMYKCMDCMRKDKTTLTSWKCAYCRTKVNPVWIKRTAASATGPQGDWVPPQTVIQVMRVTGDDNDPSFDKDVDPVGVLQNIILCPRHHKQAKHISKDTPLYHRYGINRKIIEKDSLLARIRQIEIRNAMKKDDYTFANRGIKRQ